MWFLLNADPMDNTFQHISSERAAEMISQHCHVPIEEARESIATVNDDRRINFEGWILLFIA